MKAKKDSKSLLVEEENKQTIELNYEVCRGNNEKFAMMNCFGGRILIILWSN
jgi:hypothetical protein